MIKFGSIIAASAVTVTVATAATGDIRLADNVAPAPFGYEAVPAKYVVAEPTRIYASTFIYPGTVDTNTLKAGETVDVLAKAKDYDWVLVGKNGIGIGYIPLSRLTVPKKP
jgi:hypothetical protein